MTTKKQSLSEAWRQWEQNNPKSFKKWKNWEYQNKLKYLQEKKMHIEDSEIINKYLELVHIRDQSTSEVKRARAYDRQIGQTLYSYDLTGNTIAELNDSWEWKQISVINAFYEKQFKLLRHELKKARRSPEYTRWRDDVLKRDNYQCRICGRGENLHAHHIKEWAKCGQLRFVLKNGLTLCILCHEAIHPYMVKFYRKYK